MTFILTAFAFVILNGFFVLAEFSLVKLRQTQVEKIAKANGWKGKILVQVHSKLDAYLSACQLGITFASLGLGWIGEPAFAELITPVLKSVGVESETTVHVVSFITAFSLISFLHIVMGELMPKSMAIRQPVKMSLFSAAPLFIFYWAMYPLIALLNMSANKLLVLFRLDHTSHTEHFVSTEELKIILKSSHHHGEFSHREINSLNQLLDLHELEISDIMRPINELILLDASKPMIENFRLILKHQFTRYPVYDNDRQNILGVLHIKDLFPALFPTNRVKDLKKYIRPILRLTTTDNVLDLLEDFRKGVGHLALVYHNKQLVGFVTFDNLLQVLTGKIRDEFHFSADDSFDLPDGSFLLKGTAPLYTLERLLKIDLSAYPVSTVMGLILHVEKRVPEQGEQIKFENFSLTIEKKEKLNQVWVRIYPFTD